ncbi:MAG: hypothetical protein QM690_02260 [Sphingobium sp.]
MQEFEYFRKRVAQEDERARRVQGTEAELVHRAMAAHYARRAVEALGQAAGNDAGPDMLRSA